MKILKLPVLLLLVMGLLSAGSTQVPFSLYLPQYAPPVPYQSQEEEKNAPDTSRVLGAFSQEQPVPVVNPYTAYSYAQMMEDSEKLQKLYPEIIATSSLGVTSGGRTLLLVKLGKGQKKITLNGSHHAREYMTSTLLMKMVEEYAYCYKNNIPFKGYDVKQLLDEVTLYFVPMVSPDGVTLVQFGTEQFKNQAELKKINEGRKSYRDWKANGRGVDLNYQYPYGWDQLRKRSGPSSEGFKGTSPATEAETRIMMNFTLENPFLLHAAYHTQGEIIYWYNGQKGKLYDQSLHMGKDLARLTGYRLLKETEQENSFGGYKDWTVTTLKKPGFTIELCPYLGSFPYPDDKFNDAWNKAGSSGLLLAEEASKMTGYDYEVYKNDRIVQVFDSKQDALDFSKKYGAGRVSKDGTTLWHK